MILPLLFLACKGGSAPTDTSGDPPAVDLVSPVPTGQARAGVVTDPAALFGGVAAEGQPGDLMLKNDRAQFIVQAARLGHNYIGPGGGVIDADLVRPAGVPGQDLLDEHAPMAGIGRLMAAETVVVLDDGTDGSAAIVRAEGPAEPMALITGAVESDGLLPTPDIWMVTDYILEADSPLLRIETELQWRDSESISMDPGDLALVSYDVATIWRPWAGLDEDSSPDHSWVAALSDEGDVALALMPGEATFAESPLQDILESVGQIVAGLSAPVLLAEGESHRFTRYLGVGRDLASLSGAWLQARGEAVETLSGTVVDAAGAPVEGARVHLRDAEGRPLTMALSAADGSWSAEVAPGSVVDAVATGRLDGVVWDIAPGAGFSGPYAWPSLNEAARDSLATGGPGALAQGYGVSEAVALGAGSPASLELASPGFLTISVADGGPAKVEVAFASGDPDGADALATDRRLVPGRPDGLAAEAFLGEGELRIPLEEGSYEVLIHRGLRWEPDTASVKILPGATATVQAELLPSYDPTGVLVGDPHSHASPSNDASVTMEQRLLSEAAHGVDLHFGTDHDHVVDYRPLLAPLGLEPWLNSIVADEVSPPSRGHINAWPLEEVADAQGHGAVRWWETWRETRDTEGLILAIRAMLGSKGGIIQYNHPLDSGVLAAAGYDIESGTVNADKWSFDFDAIEVLNGGGYSEYLPAYMDMVSRGLQPAPVGVSDGHGNESDVGSCTTFMDLGVDSPVGLDLDLLRAGMRARATVVSRGPFIEARAGGQWAPGQTLTGPVNLDVSVWGPSFVQVDVLELWQDGLLVQSLPVKGDAPEQLSAQLDLAPEADASFVLIATGAQDMGPVYRGVLPWAMTAAIRVDADGDGTWTSPKPSLIAE